MSASRWKGGRDSCLCCIYMCVSVILFKRRVLCLKVVKRWRNHFVALYYGVHAARNSAKPWKYRDLKKIIRLDLFWNYYLKDWLYVDVLPSVVYSSLTYTVALPFQHLTHHQIQLIHEHLQKNPISIYLETEVFLALFSTSMRLNSLCSPTPLSAHECVRPPPHKGGGYTLAVRRGGRGVNILEDERHRIALLQ